MTDDRCPLAEIPWALVAGWLGFVGALGFASTVAAITVYEHLRRKS